MRSGERDRRVKCDACGAVVGRKRRSFDPPVLAEGACCPVDLLRNNETVQSIGPSECIVRYRSGLFFIVTYNDVTGCPVVYYPVPDVLLRQAR